MGLADFQNNAVVVRQSVPSGVDFNGTAPGTTATFLSNGRKIIYPVDANGGLFEFDDDYAYILWEIRLNVPGATRWDAWIRNEAGTLFLLDQNLAWGGSTAVIDLRAHLTAGDDVVLTTQGAAGPGDPGIAELVFDLWGPAVMPY